MGGEYSASTELIAAWKPGAAAVTYPTIPEINTTPLLRLAATLPRDSPAYDMLLHLARLTQDRSTRSTLEDLEVLTQLEQRATDCDARHETLMDPELYPAPKDSYWGLNWGYPGSRPGSLALLISRLLDDVTAPGADNASGAPVGLEELTQIAWPHGTVFTRAQLEAARDGRPYAEE